MESADLTYIAGSRNLHVTGIPSALSDSAHTFTVEAMRAAREHGIVVTFDPNLRPVLWRSEDQMRQVVNDLARRADWVLPGVDEAKTLVGSNNPDEIAAIYLDRGASGVVVKLGALGSCAITRAGRTDVPAYPVDLVDSVGAGDGFAVGFISGLLDDCDVETCLHRGNAIGALAVTQRGDNEGLPTREALETFLARHRPDPRAPQEEGIVP